MTVQSLTPAQRLRAAAAILRDAVDAIDESARMLEAAHPRPRQTPLLSPGAILLTTAAAAEALGLGEQTLRNWRAEGHGPPAVTRGKLVRYRRADLEAWVDAEFSS